MLADEDATDSRLGLRSDEACRDSIDIEFRSGRGEGDRVREEAPDTGETARDGDHGEGVMVLPERPDSAGLSELSKSSPSILLRFRGEQ